MRALALLTAALITLVPATAILARECDKEIVNICEDGFTWDFEALACVEKPTE